MRPLFSALPRGPRSRGSSREMAGRVWEPEQVVATRAPDLTHRWAESFSGAVVWPLLVTFRHCSLRRPVLADSTLVVDSACRKGGPVSSGRLWPGTPAAGLCGFQCRDGGDGAPASATSYWKAKK